MRMQEDTDKISVFDRDREGGEISPTCLSLHDVDHA